MPLGNAVQGIISVYLTRGAIERLFVSPFSQHIINDFADRLNYFYQKRGHIMASTKRSILLFLPALVSAFALTHPVIAQPIVPESGNTIVTPDGNRLDITGGQRSGDGANLFHGFKEFNVNSGQIANFISSPQILNILARINGGNPSYINGLIQVTGGNSNLYLMNPSGIVFGANASLNVPAAFTATTANGIGFGNNWFNAVGTNNYANLIGKPNAFAFTSSQPAAIANFGDLAVGVGQDLSLLAGTIENTGKLSAPGGNLTIAAIPGQNLVRISQTGFVLSLEVATADNSPPPIANSPSLISNPVNLPQLLTGGNLGHATQVVFNPDGTIQLTGNGGHIVNRGQLSTASKDRGGEINLAGQVVENRGQIAADGVSGGIIRVEAKNFLDTGAMTAVGTVNSGGQISVNYSGRVIQTATSSTAVNGETKAGSITFNGGKGTMLTTSGNLQATGKQGGNIRLFGQDVRLLAAQLDASGKNGGGEILVGGDFQGRTQGAINAQNTFVNHASTLKADAQIAGDGGRVIVWSDKRTDYYGSITAKGGSQSGNGGLMEVSSNEELVFGGKADASAFNGMAGELLLDPKNITVDASVRGSSFQLFDPNPTVGNLFGDRIVVLTNGNIVVSSPFDGFTATDAGAVYLFNPNTGAVIGQINGNFADDRFGVALLGEEITGLPNGNFVFGNPDADIGGNGNAGTVILANGTTGAEISHISGANADDRFGNGNTIALANGNFVFGSNERVDIGITEPSSLIYGYFSDRGITINPQLITQVTDTGTAVTLQANNDITLNSPITTNNPGANGGDLTLQAGRSIILNTGAGITTDNGNLTLIANDTAANGVFDSERDPGNAVITISSGVTLNSGTGDTTITLNTGAGLTNNTSSDITIDGNILARNLTINNNGPSNGAINLSATANLNLTGILNATTTGGDIQIDIPLVLSNDAFFATGTNAGNIIFNQTVDGTSGVEALNLTAGGDITINGAVGSTTRIGNLNITNANNVTTGAITAASITQTAGSGTTTFQGDLNTNSATGISLTGNTFKLNGNVATTTSGGFTINNSNTLDISANTTFNLDGAFNQTGTGAVSLAANITTTDDDINFTAPVTLTGNVTFNPGIAKISFGSTLAAGNNPLTLRAGEIDFNGAVTGSNILVLEPATAEQDITIGDSTNTAALDLTAAELANIQDGFSLITIGRTDGSGTITLNGNSTFNNPVKIQSPTGVGSITGTGNITGSGDASITLLANQNITTGNITAPAGITITSNSGDINTSAGTLDSSSTTDNGGAISLSAPNSITASNINASGTPSGGSINLTSNIINLVGGKDSISSKNGTLTLQPFTASQDLEIAPTNIAPFQDGFISITIGKSDGSGIITVPNPITFNDPTTIQSPQGSIALNGQITGTDNASITLNAATINLNAGITTANQNIAINGNAIMGNDVTISTGTDAGDINFSGTVDGNQLLTADAGTGNVTFEGAIGNTNLLSGLNINGQNVNVNSTTKVAGNIDINSTGTLNLNNTVTTTNNGSVTLTNTQDLTLKADKFILDGAFTQDGTGSVSISGNLSTTNDDIKFSAPVTLIVNTTFNPGTATISFGSTLAADNYPLNLKAGEIDLNGSVSGTNTLALEPATAEQNIALGSSTNSTDLDLTAAEIANLQDGFKSITIGSTNRTGNVTINNSNFNDPVTIQSGNGTINLNGNLTGTGDASITLDAPTTTLNGNITTANQNITIAQRILLGSDVKLSTGTDAGDINFKGTVDGTQQLQLEAGTGNIRFNAAVGNTNPLSKLDIISAGNVFVSSGITTNNSPLTFNVPVTLTEDAVLNTGNGDITFANILDGEAGETNDLTLRAGRGNVNFNGVIGGGTNQQLGAISIESAANLAATSNINAGSLRYSGGTGTISLQGNVTTTDTDGVNLTTGGNISTANITSKGGNINLTSNNSTVTTANLDASSTTGNGGAIALSAPNDINTGNLTSHSNTGTGGNLTIDSQNGIIKAGDLDASGNSKGGNITVMAKVQITAGKINSSAVTGDGGNVFIDPENDIQVEYINAQGGSSGTGGQVDITTDNFFRALGSFTDQNGVLSSISTAGGTGGGAITINHAGGDKGDPIASFIIGNSSKNGTAGAITSGTSTLALDDNFPRSDTRGNIRLVTDDGEPTPTTPVVTTPTNPVEPTPVTPTNPVEPTPVTPVVTNPTNPVEPTTTTPVVTNPTNPVEPTPVTPVVTNPTNPVEPTPVTPTNPVEPTPTTPVVTTPTNPVEPTATDNPNTELPSGDLDRSLTPQENPAPQSTPTNTTTKVELDESVAAIEEVFTREYEAYLGQPPTTPIQSIQQIQTRLREVERETSIKPALLYIVFGRQNLGANAALICPLSESDENRHEQEPFLCDRSPNDTVELIVVTGNNEPIRLQIPEAKRQKVEALVKEMREEITKTTRDIQPTDYRKSSQELYQLLIARIEPVLKQQGITNLIVVPDVTIRSLPIAALHDGQQFLIEKYNIRK